MNPATCIGEEASISWEADMRGIETGGDSEMAYRRGYEHGVIELFYAIKRFLDPRTQEGARAGACPVTPAALK